MIMIQNNAVRHCNVHSRYFIRIVSGESIMEAQNQQKIEFNGRIISVQPAFQCVAI